MINPSGKVYKYKCVCVCVCLCSCFTSFVIFLRRGYRTLALTSECKIYQTDLTDSMPFLPAGLTEEISPNPEVLRASN